MALREHDADDGSTGGIRISDNGTPHLPSIVSAEGARWIDVRRSLTPRYGVVWRDIALCYLLLVLGVAAVAAVERTGPLAVAVTTAVPAVVWTGYWLHALFLFGHEAAHSNLAPTRRRNDRVADWSVWLLFGSTTKNYRRTHMTHHGHLGDHQDTETTYHLCMSALNLVKAATGLFVLEVLLRKARQSAERAEPAERVRARSSGTAAGVLASVRSAALHLAVVGLLFFGGFPVAAATWVLGVACAFPLFATVRTIVEHRRADAACAVDFAVELHGPVNRLFGTGLVSRYFGSAGFNRHLLHHWDPAISYTRFDEMERFFLSTPLAAEMEASRTGYSAQIRTLMAEARRG